MGGADTWQEDKRIHTDAHDGRHVATGGWQVKSPRVSGPCLEYWGGNANALPRSTLYTCYSPLILLCGTMFPRKSSLAGDVDVLRALDTNQIA